MSSMTTQIKLNYKEYPECMFAMISAFLQPQEGEELRRIAGKVGYRSDVDGRTYRNGLFHSYDDLPAVESVYFKSKMWYKNGKRHRDGDKPAIQSERNSEWYVDGKHHREGGLPAVISTGRNGRPYKEWWVDGKRHREGGLPAIESDDTHLTEWWVDGKRHREGEFPALISRSGYCEWWVDGKCVKCGNVNYF